MPPNPPNDQRWADCGWQLLFKSQTNLTQGVSCRMCSGHPVILSCLKYITALSRGISGLLKRQFARDKVDLSGHAGPDIVQQLLPLDFILPDPTLQHITAM